MTTASPAPFARDDIVTKGNGTTRYIIRSVYYDYDRSEWKVSANKVGSKATTTPSAGIWASTLSLAAK